MRALGGPVLEWVVRHLSTLSDQPVGRTAGRAEMSALLGGPALETGRDFASLLAEFDQRIVPYAIRTNHPRFLAFIPSAPSFLSVLGELLCAGTNFFGGVWLEAAGPTQVELVVLDWFKDWLGYPPTAGGLLTSGGSEANLTALVAARETLSEDERDRAVLYVGEQRHWSVDRAARVMGLRPAQVVAVPGDDFRLSPAALAEQLNRDRAAGRRPWAVVASAGTTNTGDVDPLVDLAELCRRQRLWLHVDAAYGWAAVLTSEGKAELAGIEQSDSLALDPHKWLAQTFDAGCLLVRDPALLARAFHLRPEYMQDVEAATDEVNFCDLGLTLTRRFRALKIWLSVQALGLAWFRDLVAHTCRLAQLAEGLLAEAGCFEILSPPRLSIVCFRYRPPSFTIHNDSDEERLDRLNLALTEALRAGGRAFLSSTRLRGRVSLRFCFVNWRTTTADVEEVVELLRNLGAGLTD
jgi:glutamate/tyrosine decarboxylase-like PLP-dependent enzyme